MEYTQIVEKKVSIREFIVNEIRRDLHRRMQVVSYLELVLYRLLRKLGAGAGPSLVQS